MTFTEAFATYGARLVNPMWSICALAPDGSLVVSLWQSWFTKGPVEGTLIYADRLSDWKGNEPGKNEFRRQLSDAYERKVPLRIVLAHPVNQEEAEKVGQVSDESTIKKTFSVRQDWLGSIDQFDGDEYKLLVKRVQGR